MKSYYIHVKYENSNGNFTVGVEGIKSLPAATRELTNICNSLEKSGNEIVWCQISLIDPIKYGTKK